MAGPSHVRYSSYTILYAPILLLKGLALSIVLKIKIFNGEIFFDIPLLINSWLMIVSKCNQFNLIKWKVPKLRYINFGTQLFENSHTEDDLPWGWAPSLPTGWLNRYGDIPHGTECCVRWFTGNGFSDDNVTTNYTNREFCTTYFHRQIETEPLQWIIFRIFNDDWKGFVTWMWSC